MNILSISASALVFVNDMSTLVGYFGVVGQGCYVEGQIRRTAAVGHIISHTRLGISRDLTIRYCHDTWVLIRYVL